MTHHTSIPLAPGEVFHESNLRITIAICACTMQDYLEIFVDVSSRSGRSWREDPGLAVVFAESVGILLKI
jgi:hypothetical protein